MKTWLAMGIMGVFSLMLSGCGDQPTVKVVSVEMVSNDVGSPDFKRMVKICFDKPLEGTYHHDILFQSQDGFVFGGSGVIRAAVSSPDDPCVLRNINQYVNKNSPPRARDLIDRYLYKGNVASVKVDVWADESGHKGLKMDSKLFRDL